MKYFAEFIPEPQVIIQSPCPNKLVSKPAIELSLKRQSLRGLLALSSAGLMALGFALPAHADATIDGPGTPAMPGDGATVTLTPPLNNEGVTGGANNVTVEIVDQSSAGISTSGQPGIVLGQGATVNVGAAGQVVTQGDNARGIDLGNIARATLNGMVSTSGEASGAFVAGANSTVDVNGTVRTGGGNSAAVTVGQGSTVNVNMGADVRTGNSNSDAVLLQGDGTTLNVAADGLVTTSSGQSSPVRATGNDASINVAGEVRSSSGNADAIRVEGDNGQVTVSNGGFVTAQSSGSDAIDMTGSGGTVTVEQGGEVRISSGNSAAIRGGAMGTVNVAGMVGISSSSSQGVVLDNMGTLNVQDGGLIETSSSESQAVLINEAATSATVNVNQGGTINAIGAQAIVDRGMTNSTVTVDGRVFGGSSDAAIDLGAGMDMLIINGEVEGSASGPAVNLGMGDDTATLNSPGALKGPDMLLDGGMGTDVLNINAGDYMSGQFMSVETVNVAMGGMYSVNDSSPDQTVNVMGQNSSASVDQGGTIGTLNSSGGAQGQVNMGGTAQNANADGMGSATNVNMGGTVNQANAQNGGQTNVNQGGNAQNATADGMGSSTNVNQGGMVGNATANNGGSTQVNMGGMADTTNSNGMGSRTDVNMGGQVNNANANMGGQTNVNQGGQVQNANANMGGQTNVNQGGMAGNATSDGMGSATNVNQGGMVGQANANNGGATQVNDGGQVQNSNASNGGRTDVNQGGRVNSANSNNGGQTNVNQGGNVDSARADQGGSTNVNQGGRVSNNTTGSGGTTNVNNGGQVDATNTEAGGTTNVNQGGNANGVRADRGGTVNVNNGARANLADGVGGGGNINFRSGSSTDVQARATGQAVDARPTTGLNYEPGTRVNVIGSPFFTASAAGDTVTLTRGANAFRSFAQGRNQRAVASALDRIGATGNNPVVAGLVLTQPGQIGSTYDRLGGELVPSTALGLVNAARAYTDIMLRRTSINFAATGSGTTPYGAGSRAEEIVGVAPDGTVLVGDENVKRGPNFWVGAFGRDTEIDRGAGGLGLDTDSYGGALGAEFALGNQTMAGLSLGYSNGDVSLRGLGDSADIDTFHAGAYLGTRSGDFDLGVALGYGNHNSDTRRTVQNASGLQNTTGSFDGQTYSVSAEALYNVSRSSGLRLAPLATLNAVRVTGDFDERGAGDFGLRGDVGETLVFGGLGVQVAGGGGSIRPSARVLYERAFDGDVTATNRFVGAPGTGFGIVGFGGGKDRVRASLGLDIASGKRTAFNISAETIQGSNVSSYGGAARFSIRF